jgi:hypothetical protein
VSRSRPKPRVTRRARCRGGSPDAVHGRAAAHGRAVTPWFSEFGLALAHAQPPDVAKRRTASMREGPCKWPAHADLSRKLVAPSSKRPGHTSDRLRRAAFVMGPPRCNLPSRLGELSSGSGGHSPWDGLDLARRRAHRHGGMSRRRHDHDACARQGCLPPPSIA